MNITTQRVAERMKALRMDKGWSREMVARRLGVSQQQVERYETGENAISIEKLSKTATLFHVGIGTFFD